MRCTPSLPSRVTHGTLHAILCLHIQTHSCQAPSAPGLPAKRVVAAFSSSNASTASVEKLHQFFNDLIQMQLLQLLGGMLSKSSQSVPYRLRDLCVPYRH